MEYIAYLWQFFAKQQMIAERRTPNKKAMMVSNHETTFNTVLALSAIRRKKMFTSILF